MEAAVASQGRQRLEQLLALETGEAGWEDLGSKHGVRASRLEAPSGLYYLRGVCDIACPAETILTFTQDYGQKRRWDDQFEEGRIVEAFSDNSGVAYERYKGMWPVSGRDFCLGTWTMRDEEKIVDLAFSITHPAVPEVSGVVRAEMEVGGFIYRKLSPTTTRVCYLVYLDLKGSLPVSLVNMLQKQQTQVPAQIRDCLRETA